MRISRTGVLILVGTVILTALLLHWFGGHVGDALHSMHGR